MQIIYSFHEWNLKESKFVNIVFYTLLNILDIFTS